MERKDLQIASEILILTKIFNRIKKMNVEIRYCKNQGPRIVYHGTRVRVKVVGENIYLISGRGQARFENVEDCLQQLHVLELK